MKSSLEKDSGGHIIEWKAVYEEHGSEVLAFLRSRLGNRDDAEDILQETFIRAINASDSIRDTGKVRSYLFTIAHNLMVNFVKRRRELTLSNPGNDSVNVLEQFEDRDSVSPESETMFKSLEENVRSVLGRMPPAHRKAFELGVLGQKSYGEISRITGWSLAQVKINIYRARKKAIEELRDDWYRE